jgi:polysaccharide deacetylase family protein (PEP-CTERM system associated)
MREEENKSDPMKSTPHGKGRPPCMFSVDVEDWFQVENLKGQIDRSSWDDRQLRVEANTDRILQMLSDHQTKATFFVLGWIAKRCPALIQRIAEAGHEIASHGMDHHLLGEMSQQDFQNDIVSSRALLEDLTGVAVIGYRAPSFSITDWAIPMLSKAGFLYDSSFFYNPYHSRYGTLTTQNKQGIIPLQERFHEIAIPSLSFMGRSIPWGGGGYFRLYPIGIFCAGITRIMKAQGEFLFYMHPWEIDPGQPRINGIKKSYAFRHYYGLAKTEEKLKRLLETFRFVPIQTRLKTEQ